MANLIGTYKLGRSSGRRKALFKGLVRSLVIHQRIQTTEARAKAVRPIAEKLLTFGRRALEAMEGGETPENRAKALHYRRLALAYLPDTKTIQKLFDEIAPKYRERHGGYTRILKIGYRKGDAAPVVLLEFV